jgi:hypothetical protein
MKRFLVAALFSLGLWGSSAGQLFAQIGSYTPPINMRPPVSPYLNMFRSGNPAIDYYGIVQPQLQTQQQLFQMQTILSQPANNINQYGLGMGMGTGGQSQDQMVNMTGHPVMFMNYSYYYPMMGGQGGGGLGGLGGASYFPYVVNNNFRR